MSTAESLDKFSLVVGGPFYRALVRLRLVEPEPNIARRITVLVSLTWLPLFGLSWVQGSAFGNKVQVPLLLDFSIWGRFFGTLPLLIVAERVIDPWINRVVKEFESSGIIREPDLPAFRVVLAKIKRLRDSGFAELALALLAVFPFFLVFDYEWISNGVSAWHGSTTAGLSTAGWWFAFISSPILRFLMFRWIWRYALWSALLYKIMKLDLNLKPAHPDLLGGMGFVLSAQQQFGILIAAFGTSMAGQYANAIAHFDLPLKATTAPMVIFVVIAVLIVLGPLTVLSPQLSETKRNALARYSQAARRLTASFESKWIDEPPSDEPPARESMMGNADPSSLTDYISIFNVVRDMQIIPVSKQLVIVVAAEAAAPLLLVWLFSTPVESIVQQVFTLLF